MATLIMTIDSDAEDGNELKKIKDEDIIMEQPEQGAAILFEKD